MISNNKKGFTLVELLVTIGIIGIILTISTVSVYTIINNSKDNSNKLTIDNMKKSAGIYVKEYKNEVSWDKKNTNEYEACIPIQTLIAKGYLKEEVLNNENIPLSIKLIRDEYNNIISEISQEIDCVTYTKIVKIPTSSEICNNVTYDGESHNLIKENISMTNYKAIKYVGLNEDELPKNAGEYKISIDLANEKQWSDNTTDAKMVTCKISKAIPVLELDHLGNNATDIGTKEIKLRSRDVSGNISIESSNKNYVTAEIADGKKIITAGGEKKINITTLAKRNSTTSVTITVTPTGDYAKNYEKATITYTVGNIKTVKVDKPTSDICYDLSYNGNSQQLAKNNNKAYQLIDNYGTKIGTYIVTTRLNYGYVWADNTTDNVEFDCQIKTPKPIITYDNATCSPGSITVTYNKTYGENQSLCIPTKTGYTFDGWYSDSKLTQEITNNTTVTNFKNHNLYAKWNANEYTVTLDANGGTVTPTSIKVTYDKTYDTLPEATRTGYTFEGWYTKLSGGTKVTKDNKVSITKEQTLYAHWNTNEYTVTLDANGGTVTPKSIKVTYNKTYTELPEATRVGYTFNGWYTEKTNGIKITKDDKVNITSDTTLYAYWLPNPNTEYVVKHYKMNLDSKNYTLADTETLAGETDSSVIPNTKNYTGFTAPKKQSLTIKADGSSILKYYYSRNSYKITFDANGGNVSTSSKTVLYEDIYGSLPEASRTGYIFDDWYTEKSGGTKITKNSQFTDTSAQVLYAHWKPIPDTKYVIEHYKMNLDGINYTLADTEQLTGETDSSVTPNTKNYTGFTAPKKQTVTIKADGSSVVKYYYSRNSYTVTLNKENGISSVTGNGTYKYGESVTITATPANGFMFNGWTGTYTSKTTSYTFTISTNNVEMTATAKVLFTSQKFEYIGKVEEFPVPATGTYQLEVWGAAGGNSLPLYGGKGGYSKGTIKLNEGDILYVCVGQKGLDYNGSYSTKSYNGGGAGGEQSGGGGGATHIATANGALSELSSNKSAILIVAGGGGGADYEDWELGRNGYGGDGGGTTGSNGGSADNRYGTGGTQTAAGYYFKKPNQSATLGGFGYGGGDSTIIYGGGGGGGYYGGGAGGYANGTSGGGGGSGYIGGVSNGEMKTGIQNDNGYAIITLIDY